MFPVGAAHGIASRLTTITNKFHEFLRRKLQTQSTKDISTPLLDLVVHCKVMIFDRSWHGRTCTRLNWHCCTRLNWHCACRSFHTEFLIPETIDTMLRVAIVQANWGCFKYREDVIFIGSLAHENLCLFLELTVRFDL